MMLRAVSGIWVANPSDASFASACRTSPFCTRSSAANFATAAASSAPHCQHDRGMGRRALPPLLDTANTRWQALPALAGITAASSVLVVRRQRHAHSATHSGAVAVRARSAKGDSNDMDPTYRYNQLKENFFGSWLFLEDDAFAIRLFVVFVVGFALATVLLVNIYPPLDTDGDIAINNLAASFLIGCGLSLLLVVGTLLWLGGQLDRVNRLLQTKAIVLEVDPTNEKTSGTYGFYTTVARKSEDDAKRDKLVATYSTEPALSRVRTYLVASVVCSAVAWVGGTNVGGEVLMAEEDEEGEEDGVYRDNSGADDIKRCKGGCLPGAGNVALGWGTSGWTQRR